MEENKRGFFWTEKAWYAKSINDQDVMFGMYGDGDGLYGEMAMEWEELGGKEVPKLQVYNDGWEVLASFQDLLQRLAGVNGENITQGQFVEILKGCGFEDLTPYNSPYENAPLLNERQELQKRIDEIDEELNAD